MALRQERKATIDKARALVTAAQNDDRTLSEEEQVQYDELLTRSKDLQGREERMIEIEGLDHDLRDVFTPAHQEQEKTQEDRFEHFGEQLQAIARAYSPARQVDQRLQRATGLNEGNPSEGGFLVQTDFAAELLKRTYETGILSTRVRRIPISANSNGLKVNGVDESSRQNGSRWGGVRGYWLNEGGTKTPTQPAFRQIELNLKKLIGACWATDELMEDSVALGAILQEAFAEEFAFMVDEAIYRGDGAGKPLGILNSPSLITVAAEGGQAASTILYDNIVKMWARLWSKSRRNAIWIIDQSIEPQLFTMSMAVGVGGVPVYLPAGGASASPYGTLFGRPVVPIEQASALGTVGDIALIDPTQYTMIDKGGIKSASSIHVNFLQDEQVFRFVYRVDGQPTWNTALTPYNGGDTISPFVTLAERV